MYEQINLLLVDDDALDRRATRRALRESGLDARIVETEDGDAAMRELRRGAFDCILLDYRLPGADGLEMLRAIRAAGITTPVIVLTGQGDEQLAVEIMKSGATDYLAKGRLSAEVLASSVRNALRIHRAEQQAAEAELQRREAQARLRQNERLLAITLKSIGDAVIATDERGCVTFMNAAAEHLTGWTAPEAIGHALDEVLPLADRASRARIDNLALHALRSTGALDTGRELLAHDRGGRIFPVVSSSAPIRSEDGAPVGVVVVLRDITERVRIEERLRFLADLSRLLASSLDYRQHLINLAQLAVPRLADWCAIDVRQSDNEIERVALACAHEADQSIALQPINPADDYGSAAVIRNGRTEYLRRITPEQLAKVTPDHRHFAEALDLISWISVPLQVRGESLGAISLGRTHGSPVFEMDDVAFAEELARRTAHAVDNALLYREAQEAIHTRDAFLSVAAHELKTPLTSMMGYAELLQRRLARSGELGERERRLVDVVNDQARRLNKMVIALFDLSRLQMGQLNIERRPIDLAALTTRIVEEVRPTLDRHTLQFTTEGAPIVISGDELRLEQVIQNLLQNAIKYSPEGGAIAIRVAQQNGWAILSVEDQGLGIPKEALPRIFRRFYRAANADAHQTSGMGVGLYVAQQIVDLHGGRVEVESTEGVGSTFTVWLPTA